MGFADPPATTAGGQYIRSATLVVAASDSMDTRNVDYVCDGTADQVEINQAIAALPAGGGLIHLLEGTYNVSGAITIDKDNIAILGTGANTVIRIVDGHNANINVIEATNFDNILIKDIRIDGNRANQTAGIMNGIYFNVVTHSKVESCWAEDMYSSGIYLTFGSNYNTISGNVAQGNGYGGIYIYSSFSNTVTGNLCQDNTQVGILIDMASCDNTVVGNTCQGNIGIGVWNSSDRNAITGNTCQGNDWHGIYLAIADHNAVIGNTVENNGLAADNTYDGIHLWGACEYNNIQGNTVRTTVAAPPPNRHRYGINISAAACTGNAVVNNDLYQAGQTGGYNDAGTNTRGTADGQWPVPVTREGSTLVVAATDSIDPTRADYQCDGASDETEINAAIVALGATGGTVKLLEGTFTVDGSIDLTSNVALVGQGAGTVITLPNGHDVGIVIINVREITRVLIKDLRVDGNRANQAAGVMTAIGFYEATHSKVVNCWAENMYGGHGIFLNHLSNDNLVTGNSVITNAGNGIMTDEASNYNVIEANTVRGNGYHGINITASLHNIISDNEVINNSLDVDVTYDGIYVGGVSPHRNNIHGNIIRTTVGAPRHRYGINITSGNANVVKDNDLWQSGQTAYFNDTGTLTMLPELWVNSIFDDSDAQVTLANLGDHVCLDLADAQDTHVRFNFRVPADFHQLVRARILIVPEDDGDLYWGAATQWGPCAGTWADGADAIALHAEAVTQNEMECLDINAALDGMTAGQHVGVNFQRDATNVLDTINAVVHLLQFWMQYV